LDDMKILAATTTDDAIVAKAFAGIVRAYKHGWGAPRSEFAAAQWLERLKEVLPGTSSSRNWNGTSTATAGGKRHGDS
ncbi:hypothetical protein Q5692_40220, partial [Microcoleus sp. C2C3]|uniref:hypothetical protein n=1 Tax=Microcoleus sp. C2C3 TaxID=3055324 RepID=UPI002FD00BFC